MSAKAKAKRFFVEGKQVYTGSHSESPGKRKTMEDASTVVGEIFGPKTQYYGVFDGHGGSKVSLILAQKLHVLLKEKYSEEKPLDDVIRECFTEMDSDLAGEFQATGSTAAIALIIGNRLTVANCGDTRVLYIDENGNVSRLTVDHNVENESELERVVDAGAAIFNGRVNGMLCLTRCFGDSSQSDIVTCEPHITSVDFNEKCRLIIACDGVFEVMEDNEVAELFTENDQPSVAAKAIKDEALKRGTTDNVTVITVSLKPKI